MKDAKLYKVGLGYIDTKSGDTSNWSSTTVIAKDAMEAVKRVKLKKREYIADVNIISTVDVQ